MKKASVAVAMNQGKWEGVDGFPGPTERQGRGSIIGTVCKKQLLMPRVSRL